MSNNVCVTLLRCWRICICLMLRAHSNSNFSKSSSGSLLRMMATLKMYVWLFFYLLLLLWFIVSLEFARNDCVCVCVFIFSHTHLHCKTEYALYTPEIPVLITIHFSWVKDFDAQCIFTVLFFGSARPRTLTTTSSLQLIPSSVLNYFKSTATQHTKKNASYHLSR